MALNLKDCPPALRAKLEAAIEEQYPTAAKFYAMATFLKGQWTIGPMTDDKALVEKLVANFNVSTPAHCQLTLNGKPPAVTVQIE